MESDIFVLLLGACEGAYALAASFRGEYGIPVVLIDEEIPDAYHASRFFTECRAVTGIGYTGLFRRALSDFYEAHAGKSLILLPMTEKYAERVIAEREMLEKMYLLPQKEVPVLKTPQAPVSALLLSYTRSDGARRLSYARVCAQNEKNEPLAVITADAPQALLDALPPSNGGIALYGVCENNALSPMGDGGALSPFCDFPSAADTSLAEWIISDYVFCHAANDPESAPTALFSPYPLRKTEKYLQAAEKENFKSLRRHRLFITLSPPRGETRRPRLRLILRRFYRENLAKKIKQKK